MATQPSRKFMTYQEFEALPRHGILTELLDGEYFVVSPVLRHQRLFKRLLFELECFLRESPVAEVVPAPFDTVLSKELARVIQPDLLVLTVKTIARMECNRRGEEARLIGMPDLAIEVLSSDGRYDRGKKLSLYEEYRVPELWHVTPDSVRVEVYRTDAAGCFAKAQDLGPGDELGSPLLPGFALDLTCLYRGLLTG